ncbi:ABC transporter substrate-binding protein [Roseibacillus persicicus]|uniref:ABC transporter substrate-binding protein n=1 Tax=Roseibacillus persicicus TaxID=454148 RepID=UPI00280D7D17|nr:extracellular solute-binding protein [Roseibacillus persicicus]MDQ8192403.1 extracellular solute-binding protein [Roseibacillus persicicus]
MKLWQKLAAVLVPLGIVVALPLVLRRDVEVAPGAGVLRLEVITPHNETIQREFGEAFVEWYQEKHGREVYVNWLVPGGTSEIKRVLDSGFDAAAEGGREGIGIDLFFGGGEYDFSAQSKLGRFAKLEIFETHPELFEGENAPIPATMSGETYYGSEHDWVGVCLSSFGIVYNVDGLKRLGLPEPKKWEDLTDQRYIGSLALADPTKSGSVAKMFEMMIQEVIAEEIAAGKSEEEALEEGWKKGVNRIRMIAANSRYFTDSSAKIPHDVAQGNAVAGMSIDFYGRTFEEEKRKGDGSSRVKFVVPEGGTSISVDPVAILKGAPHPELAQEFVEFLFTERAQMLWAARKGEEFGPRFRSLRRLPVRRDLYDDEHRARMVDGEVRPYELAQKFEYRGDWTGRLFTPLRTIVRVMCIDSHDELKSAWAAMAEAGKPSNEQFSQIEAEGGWPSVSYQAAGDKIRATLKSDKAVDAVRMQRELGEFFRENYRQVAEQP